LVLFFFIFCSVSSSYPHKPNNRKNDTSAERNYSLDRMVDDLNNSLHEQIQHVNKLINTHFDEASKDSILSKLSLARRALMDKGLGYKMLSNDKETVDKLDGIDESYARTYDFGKHVWDYKIYCKDVQPETKDIKVLDKKNTCKRLI